MLTELSTRLTYTTKICDKAIMPRGGTTSHVNGDHIAEIYKAARLRAWLDSSAASCAHRVIVLSDEAPQRWTGDIITPISVGPLSRFPPPRALARFSRNLLCYKVLWRRAPGACSLALNL